MLHKESAFFTRREIHDNLHHHSMTETVSFPPGINLIIPLVQNIKIRPSIEGKRCPNFHAAKLPIYIEI
jgi:hypothetical protein